MNKACRCNRTASQVDYRDAYSVPAFNREVYTERIAADS